MNRKAHVACNFNCLLKNEGLLKVTASHVVYTATNQGAGIKIFYTRWAIKRLTKNKMF